MPAEMIKVGELRSPHGIQGWLKLYSYTEPRDNLFDYQPWSVFLRGKKVELTVTNWREQGAGLVVKFDEIADRTQAEALLGAELYILPAQIPKPKSGEYYTSDLVGFEVVNMQEQVLGMVCGFFDTAAHSIIEVGPASNQQPEHLVPWHDSTVQSVDTAKKQIHVDWPLEF